jgi:hypothetical protein
MKALTMIPQLPSARDEQNSRMVIPHRGEHRSIGRRFVDPATCDRDYSGAEMEFLGAIQEYKRSSNRQFPTWSEVLEVIRSLGYEKAGD